MICKSCNAEISDVVKFCPKCGQKVMSSVSEVPEVAAPEAPVLAEAPAAPAVPAAPEAAVLQAPVAPAPLPEMPVPPAPEEFIPAPPVEPQKKAKKSKLGKIIIVLMLVVAVVAAAIFVVFTFLLPADMLVAKAFVKNVTEIQSEYETIQETLPVTNHLLQVSDTQQELLVSVSAEGQSIDVSSVVDYEQKQMTLEADVLGMLTATAYLSTEEMVVQTDVLSDAIGLNLVTLADDLDNYALADLSEYADMYRELDGAESMLDTELLQQDVTDLLVSTGPALLASFEIEKGEKTDLEINGEDITATGYDIMVDPDALEDALYAMVDELMDKEYLLDYIYAVYDASVAASGYSMYMMDLTDDLLEEALLAGVDQLVAFAEDELEDYPLTAYIYGGRVVLLSLTDEDFEEGVGIAFNPEGDILEYIAVVMLDDEEWEDVAVQQIVMDDENFSFETSVQGVTYFAIDYDYTDTSNNFTIKISDGYSDMSMKLDVDATEENSLRVGTEYEGVTFAVESKISDLGEDWYEVPLYKNVLLMSEDELMSLMMEIYYTGLV